jgi:hypothetical protein
MVCESYCLNWWDQRSVAHFIERPENLQGTAECAMGADQSVTSRFYMEPVKWCDGW